MFLKTKIYITCSKNGWGGRDRRPSGRPSVSNALLHRIWIQLRWNLLSILLSIFFKRKSPLKAIFSLKNGWGGRDRTYACRSQSPMPYHLATPQYFKIKASSLYKSRKKVKIFLRFLRFSLFFFAWIYIYIFHIFTFLSIIMNFLKLLMSRPSDATIKKSKIILGLLLILIGVVAFYVQDLSLENSIFGITLSSDAKMILSYIIIAVGFIPLIIGGFDINILSRGYTRILQIVFGVFLMLLSGIFIDTATLSVDIFYFLLGLVVFFIGISGKFITQKGLKYGQKITKIRV